MAHFQKRHNQQSMHAQAVVSRARYGDALAPVTNLKERRNAVLKWSSAFNGLMTTAALLVPLMAAADSQFHTGAATTAWDATAHVNFKIIIAQVLYVRVASGNDHIGAAETVAVMSTGHNVMLNATVRRPDDDGSDTSTRKLTSSAIAAANLPVSGDDVRGHVILNAAARKAIVQDAPCTLGDAHPAGAPAETHGRLNVNTVRVVCTASMP